MSRLTCHKGSALHILEGGFYFGIACLLNMECLQIHFTGVAKIVTTEIYRLPLIFPVFFETSKHVYLSS